MNSKEEIIKKIESIDWEFIDSNTQYLSHNIHRYSGKFIPQIAKSVIELFTEEGDTVFDPYLGSGTTALEAILSKRKSIGVDINPLAILISKVKTSIIQREKLETFRQELIASVNSVCGGQISLFSCKYSPLIDKPEDSKRYYDEWNKKWYQEHVLRQLIMIYSVIESVDDLELKQVAQIAFSDILRKSSNASSRYPNVMYDKNHKEKPLPLKSFTDSFCDLIDKLISTSNEIKKYNISNEVELCNNTHLPYADNCMDAIITHSPYVAAVPYAEYGCLSLEWLGYNSKELDAEITGGKRHRKDVAVRFERDYNLMMEEAYRVLKGDKYAFFMVGNPTANGKVVDLHEMTVRLAKENGFEYIYTATRKGSNRRGNNMGIEYLEFFRKPL